MTGIKIHNYPLERFSFGKDDYYDIDYYDGATYHTAKIKGSTILQGIEANLPSINLYNTNGTLTNDRTLLGAGFTLFMQNLGQFLLSSYANDIDNVVFEINDNSNFFGLVVRDETTGNRLLATKDGFVEISGAYNLPKADGNVGQIITTDGAGNLTWTDNVSGVQSTGTNNHLARFNPDGQNLVDSLLTDNGNLIELVGSSSDFNKGLFFINNEINNPVNNNHLIGLKLFNRYLGTPATNLRIRGIEINTVNVLGSYSNIGIRNGVNGSLEIGGNHIKGISNFVGGNVTNDEQTFGIYNQVGVTSTDTSQDAIGIYSRVFPNVGSGGTYLAQFRDGTEGSGKFLKSVTNDGKANWSDLAISDVANLQTEIDTKTDKLITENAQTNSYFLTLNDANKLISMNLASAGTLTIPANGIVPFPIGTQILVVQVGAGAITINADPGVLIQSYNSLVTTAGQFATVSLIKRGTNTWLIIGNLE